MDWMLWSDIGTAIQILFLGQASRYYAPLFFAPISCRLKQTWVVGGMSWGLNLFQRTLNHSLSYRRRGFAWSSE
jgi:hypothetical protein